jgi:hypothetical protein
MPQKASVFCNFYIRVDREALVSERALDVGSVAFKVMSTKIKLLFDMGGQSQRKRETVKQKKGRYLSAEKLLRPREMKITPTRAKWRLCS